MFENINLEVFGAFAATLGVLLVWINKEIKEKNSFKKELSEANKRYQEMATKSTEALTLATKVIDDKVDSNSEVKDQLHKLTLVLESIKEKLS